MFLCCESRLVDCLQIGQYRQQRSLNHTWAGFEYAIEMSEVQQMRAKGRENEHLYVYTPVREGHTHAERETHTHTKEKEKNSHDCQHTVGKKEPYQTIFGVCVCVCG